MHKKFKGAYDENKRVTAFYKMQFNNVVEGKNKNG